MEILFKLSNTGGNEATIANSNFKEHYSAINDNLAWKTLLPSIRRATTDFLIKNIGSEMYDAIATAYHGTDELTDEQEEFLQACQDVVAYFTMIYAAPELQVSASEMGLVEKGSSSTPTMPVAQWRYKEFKYDLTRKADRFLDYVIQLLEKYVHDAVEFFDTWKTSNAYTDTRTVFFQSADQFDKYVKINGSRRLFAQISQDITRVEEEVDKIICVDQFNALSDAIKDGDASDDEKALIEQIRRYVAPKAMASAASLLSLNVDAYGLSLSSYADGIESHNNLSMAARGAEAVGAYVLKLRTDSDYQHQVLMNFIHSKIATYTLIAESDCYARYNTERRGLISSANGVGGVML